MPKERNPSGRFWAYEEGAPGEPAVLRLDGVIASESWWGDEVTPAAFREELDAHPGDIVVYINSPGGDVFAGSQIYSMLIEHKGDVTVKIDGIAASAASVIAMAGTKVLMSPMAYMMIHNAWSVATGNKEDMRHEADVLEEIDAGIRTAYQIKTGLSDRKLKEMMEAETWMSARTAVTLGFADGLMGAAEIAPEAAPEEAAGAEKGIAAALKGLPAVAWSGRRQIAALRRQLRDEEVLASANRAAMAALRDADRQRAAEPEEEEAPESDPADGLLRKRLLLL